jgi:hypothetical protein
MDRNGGGARSGGDVSAASLLAKLAAPHQTLLLPPGAPVAALNRVVLDLVRGPTTTLVLRHACHLTREQAVVLRSATDRGLVLVLQVPLDKLQGWSAQNAVQACGAMGLLISAPVGDWNATCELATAKLATTRWAVELCVDAGPWPGWAALAGSAGQVLLRIGGYAKSPVELAELVSALGDVPAGVAVSHTWPACLRPAATPVIPGSSSAMAAIGLQRTGACSDCQLPVAVCGGIPAAWDTDTIQPLLRPVGSGVAPRHRWSLASEWLGLRLGLRKVWRAEVTAATLPALVAATASEGWSLVLGPQIAIDDSGLWMETDPNLATDLRQIVYVAPNSADARACDALEAEVLAQGHALRAGAGDEQDRAMGALLGYPPCCVQAVIAGHAQWDLSQAHQLSEAAYFFLRAARTSERLVKRLDVWSPIQGASPLRHYPCRLDCPASLALADQLDNAAWEADSAVLARQQRARADGLLVFANGAALPLRGTPVGGDNLLDPRPLQVDARNWTPLWEPLCQAVVPQLAGAVRLAPRNPWTASGGVVVTRADGTASPLLWPEADTHPDFPRLAVFTDT